jgi:hypothetical protein
MKPQPSRINLGGFSFELPGGFAFHDVEMTIERDGQPVAFKLQRREVREADQLDSLPVQQGSPRYRQPRLWGRALSI